MQKILTYFSLLQLYKIYQRAEGSLLQIVLLSGEVLRAPIVAIHATLLFLPTLFVKVFVKVVCISIAHSLRPL